MKRYSMRIRDKEFSFTGQISAIRPFVEGIRNSGSNNPSALPLRRRRGEKLPDWASDPSSRETNRLHQTRLRKAFLETELSLHEERLRGLYFFQESDSKPIRYYYIGKAKDLGRRIAEEHLKNKDFIFHSLAYPRNRELYLSEVLNFYGTKPEYSHLRGEYVRGSECLKKVPFDHITWIGCNDLSMQTWEAIESHFIPHPAYRPCCNVSKTSATPLEAYRPEFDAVQSVLSRLLSEARS